MIKTEKAPPQETAVLVCTADQPSDVLHADPLDELKSLADTAGLVVVETLQQRVNRPNTRFYIGKGKTEELAQMASGMDADLVVFDCDLSPAQVRNVEKAIGLKVIDHTELILDIFAAHARTRQAMLQVELAQLEYNLPRLKRMWTHLSRIEGGIGLRGPGEKQLELDRRLIRNRIGDLKRQLAQIEKQKERQVAARAREYTVSLVGYTNAGKSTLMNGLTGADVSVEDKLFSTLDTRTRAWRLGGSLKVLLSDTVGFIHNLPHTLVASFHATLEETQTADLLLHVVDASSPHAEEQIEAVHGVLAEIGCADKPMLMVLNKIDRVEDKLTLRYLSRLGPANVEVSARTGDGLDRLEQSVLDSLRATRRTVSFTCNPADGKLLAYIATNADIMEKEYEDGIVRMTISILDRHLAAIANSPSTTILSG